MLDKSKKKIQLQVFCFFSASTTLDKQLAGSTNTVDWHVPLQLENVPFGKPWRLPLFCWQFFRSFFTTLNHLHKKKPRSVVSTGGYIALPVCLAARVLRIPIELFELNVIPGRATKFLSPFACTIFTCFEKTKQFLPTHKCKHVAYPIRHNSTAKKTVREQALKTLGLSGDKKTVLILGGSQGSLFINNAIKQWITKKNTLGQTVQIIHQTGALDSTNWCQLYKHANITAIAADFFDNVQDCYHVADLVICRSGAGSLFETLFFEKPCITIPLETKSNTHQVHNALAMQKQFPCIIILQ